MKKQLKWHKKGNQNLQLYIIAETILLLLIKIAEQNASGNLLQIIEFTAIALNTLMVLTAAFTHQPYKKKIALALMFTMSGDIFLTLLNNYYEMGIFCFCVVQTIYADEVKPDLHSIAFRLFLFVLMMILSVQKTLLVFLAAYSFSNLFMNCLDSMRKKKDDLFRYGLLLFFLCDFCVGLHNILKSGIIYSISSWLMWAFYLPSQVLLTLYCLKKESVRDGSEL